VDAFLPENNAWPDWLNLAVGYSGESMFGGFERQTITFSKVCFPYLIFSNILPLRLSIIRVASGSFICCFLISGKMVWACLQILENMESGFSGVPSYPRGHDPLDRTAGLPYNPSRGGGLLIILFVNPI